MVVGLVNVIAVVVDAPKVAIPSGGPDGSQFALLFQSFVGALGPQVASRA